MGLSCDDGGDVSDDPFHFLLGARDDASRLAFHLNPLCASVFLDFSADMGEEFS